jgi:type VI secretion system protein VasD
MSTITFVKTLPVIALVLLASGCGVTQSVSESTAAMTQAIFYKQIRTLRLDFDGRLALNTDGMDMRGLSVPVMVRVYQLRDGQSVNKVTYDDLLSDADRLLGADLLDQRSLVIKPGEGAQLDVPLNENAGVVAVVGLFREPDLQLNDWRLLLTRDDLDPDRPRVIELGESRLTLRPLAEG